MKHAVIKHLFPSFCESLSTGGVWCVLGEREDERKAGDMLSCWVISLRWARKRLDVVTHTRLSSSPLRYPVISLWACPHTHTHTLRFLFSLNLRSLGRHPAHSKHQGDHLKVQYTSPRNEKSVIIQSPLPIINWVFFFYCFATTCQILTQTLLTHY